MGYYYGKYFYPYRALGNYLTACRAVLVLGTCLAVKDMETLIPKDMRFLFYRTHKKQ